MSSESTGGSWPPESNCVASEAAENAASEYFGVDPSTVERVEGRVEEFVEEYPELAQLRLSRTPGESLKASYVEEEYREEHVEPENEWEGGHSVVRLDRAEAVTWKEGIRRTLLERHRYDAGVSGRFEDTVGGGEFNIRFSDSWTSEYAAEQRAVNAGALRQLAGGEYPEEHSESQREGECESGEWGEVCTVLLTTTGSAKPGVERLSPVDHARRIDTWESLRHRIRNLLEKTYGVPSDRWGMVRSKDVHGMDGDGGVNACYNHLHPVVYFDIEAADVPGPKPTDQEEERHGDFIERVMAKHVEECEIAEWSAHGEESVEVRVGDLEKPSAYASAYALPSSEEPLIERPIEYVTWATVLRAEGGQRISRSTLFTDAAKADFCKQNPDAVHGERLEYDRSGHSTELVCECCGSPVGIGETMTVHRAGGGGESVATDGGVEVAESCEVGEVGVRVGEGTERAASRERARQYVEVVGEPESVTAGVLGEMGVSPEHRDVVEEVLMGRDSSSVVESVEGVVRESSSSRYELKELRAWNGEEREASAGGGSEKVDLMLPGERLRRETRLQHVDVVGYDRDGGRVHGGPVITVRTSERVFSTHNVDTVVSWLVSNGYRRPWHAEMALSFECRGEGELPPEFEEPEATPPVEVGGG